MNVSGSIAQWIPFLLFLLLFVGKVIAEIIWLTRKQWTNSGKAVAFVLLTDLLSFGISTGILVVIFTVMFMMVMGPTGQGGDSPEIAYVILSIVGIILPPLLLFVIKRLGLLIFSIRSGKAAWIYSLVISILSIVIVLVPPALIFYAMVYLSSPAR